MRSRLDALLFLKCEDVHIHFNLTPDELQEYISICHPHFKHLIEFGHQAIEAYLIGEDEYETYELYSKGTLFILSLIQEPNKILSLDKRSFLYDKMIDNLLVRGNMEKDLRVVSKLKESLQPNVIRDKNGNDPFEDLTDAFEDSDHDI